MGLITNKGKLYLKEYFNRVKLSMIKMNSTYVSSLTISRTYFSVIEKRELLVLLNALSIKLAFFLCFVYNKRIF